MSLTRDEWCKLWEAAKRLEYESNNISVPLMIQRQLEKEVKFIKEKIQKVIGQME